MFFSKSLFFTQKNTLQIKKIELLTLLKIKERKKDDIELYLKAFDYFSDNPHKYDGATLVKDLWDIPGLDSDAMVHDYQYIVEGGSYNIIKKWQADIKYIKNMEKNGKGIRVTRFILLCTVAQFFLVYVNLKRLFSGI